jgi:hypothetical protein
MMADSMSRARINAFCREEAPFLQAFDVLFIARHEGLDGGY